MIVNLMGRSIQIKLVSKKALKKITGDNGDTVGYYSPPEAVIYLDKTLDAEARRRVLLHELMHATISLSGITHLLEDKMEEAICDVAENWVMLFRDSSLRRMISD